MAEFLIDGDGHIYPNNPVFASMPQMRPYDMPAKAKTNGKPIADAAPAIAPADPVVAAPAIAPVVDAGNKFQGRR
jgi:hypothetical protein